MLHTTPISHTTSLCPCCSTMLQTLAQLSEKDHGSFLRYNNTVIPW